MTKDPLDLLAPREKEIAMLAAEGRQAKQIAENLGLKTSTISSRLKRIYAKLHVNNKTELALLFSGNGPRSEVDLTGFWLTWFTYSENLARGRATNAGHQMDLAILKQTRDSFFTLSGQNVSVPRPAELRLDRALRSEIVVAWQRSISASGPSVGKTWRRGTRKPCPSSRPAA